MARIRKKKRTHQATPTNQPGRKGQAKSFVIKQGKHAGVLTSLQQDLRSMLSPNTASQLKEHKKNVLKDFINMSSHFGVSHLLVLTATENSSYLKIIKAPRGPTITLKIVQYSLQRDVAAVQSRRLQSPAAGLHSPLLVLNGFGGTSSQNAANNATAQSSTSQQHLTTFATLMQSLFPTLQVSNLKLSTCKRVVLVSYDSATDTIEIRHYLVTCTPSGVSKAVKQLVNMRSIPSLGGYDDISEYVTKSGFGSESEGEEAQEQRVQLSQSLGRGNLQKHKSRVKLQEIGPRLSLQLIKVQADVAGGKVLYHKHIQKSQQEIEKQDQEIKQKLLLKQQRIKEQQANVARKQAEKDAAKKEQIQKEADKDQDNLDSPNSHTSSGEEDDDQVVDEEEDAGDQEDDSEEEEDGSEEEEEEGEQEEQEGDRKGVVRGQKKRAARDKEVGTGVGLAGKPKSKKKQRTQ